jgi:hypothetical protein
MGWGIGDHADEVPAIVANKSPDTSPNDTEGAFVV